MSYTVELTDDAKTQMERLAPGPKAKVNKVIKRLSAGPDRRLDLRLANTENRYRAYAGQRWRVIFSVLPSRRIEIRRITRRSGAYRGMEHPGYRDLQEPRAVYIARETSVPAAAVD